MLEEELTKEAGKGIIGFFKDILGKRDHSEDFLYRQQNPRERAA